MKRNEFLKWLRKESKKLVPEFYTATHKYHTPIFMEVESDKEEVNLTLDKESKGVNLKLVNAYSENHLVNHYRRLKKGFDKHGFSFINNYFRERGFITEDELKLKMIQNGKSNQEQTAGIS